MHVESWNPSVLNEFKGMAYNRLLDAAHLVKDNTVRQLRSKIGTGATTGISRPIYKTGAYAGKKWTAREFGQLLHSCRVVQKKDDIGKEGRLTADFTNIRVYAGNNLAYYADIFEFEKPFMRPAFQQSMSEVKSICGAE